MRTMMALAVLLISTAAFAAALPAWDFDAPPDVEGWVANRAVRNLLVADGCLRADVGDDDPIICAPAQPFASALLQRVEIRMASDNDGIAEVFWAPTTEDHFGGFRAGREVRFQVLGGGEFRTYLLYPFWQGDPQTVRLRLDPPDNSRIAIDYIRVVQVSLPAGDATAWDFTAGPAGWQGLRDVEVSGVGGKLGGRVTGPEPLIISPALGPAAAGRNWLTIRMSVDAGRVGEVQVISGGVPGMERRSFPLAADGRVHTYNILASGPDIGGAGAVAVGIAPSLEPNACFAIDSIALGTAPGGPADLELVDFGAERAINRTDRESRMICVVRNRGGEPARNLRATLGVPDGMTISGPAAVEAEPAAPVRFTHRAEFRWTVRPAGPGAADMTVTIEGDNVQPQTYHATVEYTPAQPAAPAMIAGKAYAPQPHPAKSDWDIGVYYFPGWRTAGRWDPINRARYPIPVLGFYREGEPEVADWHIKWAVEHGIDFFIYDWYWSQGSMDLTHALHDGYMNARYKDYLKFCLLWANHNPPGTSSEEDLLNVTRYWLDHYFKLGQYKTVQGKPLVIIFSPGRLREDMGSKAVRVAFDKMRALCRAEGLPGLYLVACGNPSEGDRLAREGYDAATGYNYPAAGSQGLRWSPYDWMVDGFEDIWREFLARDEIKYIVPLSPGWDPRPWHGDEAVVRYDSTPDKFEDMCRRARTLLERSEQPPRLRMVVVEAWNEFGEGSYIEPTKRYGFGYLDAIRRVFTDAPEQHVDVAPEDVGLGPYDVEMRPETLDRRAWEFETAGDDEGWDSSMQMTDLRVADGSLMATSTGNDPAFFGPAVDIDADRYRRALVRMRVDKPGMGQLFWISNLLPESEATSYRFEMIPDGEFHEYVLEVGSVPTWAGSIQRLRLDPGHTRDTHIAVDYIRVVE